MWGWKAEQTCGTTVGSDQIHVSKVKLCKKDETSCPPYPLDNTLLVSLGLTNHLYRTAGWVFRWQRALQPRVPQVNGKRCEMLSSPMLWCTAVLTYSIRCPPSPPCVFLPCGPSVSLILSSRLPSFSSHFTCHLSAFFLPFVVPVRKMEYFEEDCLASACFQHPDLTHGEVHKHTSFKGIGGSSGYST